MERWKADLIDRIIRESGHTLGPYGLAIRLQQQLGMSWEEASAISGYDDRPRIYKPKPEPPRYIPTLEDIEREKRLAQEHHERLKLYRERLTRNPIERIHELMGGMKVREQLQDVRDNLLGGLGEVDPTIQITPYRRSFNIRGFQHVMEAQVGVMMLRIPCQTRLFLNALRATRDYDDFTSIGVGICMPKLNEELFYYPELTTERIGIEIRSSNLELYSSMSPEAPVRTQPLWRDDSWFCAYTEFNNDYPKCPDSSYLNRLLIEKVDNRAHILSLAQPLPLPTSPVLPRDKSTLVQEIFWLGGRAF